MLKLNFGRSLTVAARMAGVAVALMALGACTFGSRTSYLETVYMPDRAPLGEQPIPPPPLEGPRHIELVNPDPTTRAGGVMPTQPDAIAGTWTFVTPPTVTRVEHKSQVGGGYDTEYTLYNGRPGPNDKPFLVISVNGQATGLAENDAATYLAAGNRAYALNGNAAKEWTGKLKDGSAFCELLIQRIGAGPNGDVCHAMAIAHSEDERKLAEDILGSIAWKSNQ